VAADDVDVVIMFLGIRGRGLLADSLTRDSRLAYVHRDSVDGFMDGDASSHDTAEYDKYDKYDSIGMGHE